MVSAGDCLSSDDEVDVTIFNSNEETTATDWTTIVYVTGGDDLSGVGPALAKEGLDEHILTHIAQHNRRCGRGNYHRDTVHV